MTSAVSSVAQSAAVAAVLHVLCFSAVKVGVRPGARLAPCVRYIRGCSRLTGVFSTCKRNGVRAHQESQGLLGRLRGVSRHERHLA